MKLQRFSVLQLESFVAELLNTINNFPSALCSITRELEHLDLIKPKRLRLGLNNDHNQVEVVSSQTRLLWEHEEIFNTWFENWLILLVPKLMRHPKWFDNQRDVKIVDIQLFLNDGGSVKNTFQEGIMENLKKLD